MYDKGICHRAGLRLRLSIQPTAIDRCTLPIVRWIFMADRFLLPRTRFFPRLLSSSPVFHSVFPFPSTIAQVSAMAANGFSPGVIPRYESRP